MGCACGDYGSTTIAAVAATAITITSTITLRAFCLALSLALSLALILARARSLSLLLFYSRPPLPLAAVDMGRNSLTGVVPTQLGMLTTLQWTSVDG